LKFMTHRYIVKGLFYPNLHTCFVFCPVPEVCCNRPTGTLRFPGWYSRGGTPGVVLPGWYARGGTPGVVLPGWYSRGGTPGVVLPGWYSRGGTPGVVLPGWYSRGGTPGVVLPVPPLGKLLSCLHSYFHAGPFRIFKGE